VGALLVIGSGCAATGGGSAAVSSGPVATPSAAMVALNRAAAATGEVATLRFSLETSVTGLPGSGDLANRTSGEIDRRAGRAHLTTDLDSVLGVLGSAEAGDGEIEVVLDGDTVYLRSPLYRRLVGSERSWVSLPAEEMVPGGPMSGGGQSDPRDLLGVLEGAGGELTELGTEQVRGVDTRHVSTVIDVRALLGGVADDRRQALAEALDRFGGELDDLVTISAEAWVDADGHVRRFTLTFDVADGNERLGDLGDTAVTVTYELYDFDAPIEIEVPDPADVAELDLSLPAGGN
jgi:hypothetical protein